MPQYCISSGRVVRSNCCHDGLRLRLAQQRGIFFADCVHHFHRLGYVLLDLVVDLAVYAAELLSDQGRADFFADACGGERGREGMPHRVEVGCLCVFDDSLILQQLQLSAAPFGDGVAPFDAIRFLVDVRLPRRFERTAEPFGVLLLELCDEPRIDKA